MSVWLYFVFITSFVVTNTVKGTTPAFLLAFGSLLIPLFIRGVKARNFVARFSGVLGAFVLLTLLSQVVLVITPRLPSPDDLVLISHEARMLLRSSLLTQSLYLIPSFLLFAFVWTYFSPKHYRHLQLALLLFVLFGFYKWFFFLLFGDSGDFISNRTFGDDLLNPAQFQTLWLLGIPLSRFVSMTGEPSMYVFSVLPFCIYFFYRRSYLTASVLLLSLMLTFSGTFVMGLCLWALSHLAFSRYRLKTFVPVLVSLVLLAGLLPGEILSYFVKEALVDKLSQNSVSGLDRAANFFNHATYFLDAPFLVKWVGVGFGTVRSTEMFSTLLVNTGLIGFGLFTALFAYPVLRLSDRETGLKISIIVTYFIMLISVSEYSYPALWLLLGMAYNKLTLEKKSRSIEYSHPQVNQAASKPNKSATGVS